MEDHTRLADEVQYKTCTKCGKSYPATAQFFHVKLAAKGLLKSSCKSCRKIEKAEYRANNVEKIREGWKKYEEANSEVIQEKRRKYREANQEKLRKSGRKYREENRERERDRHARYQEEHAEEIRKRGRQHYIEHAAEKIARAAQWVIDNPERSREQRRRHRENNPELYAFRSRRYRAIRRSVLSEPYSTKDVLDTYGTDCYLCDGPIDLSAPRSCGSLGWQESLHIDHVVPIALFGPNTLENVRPTHALCNLRKSTKDGSHFL